LSWLKLKIVDVKKHIFCKKLICHIIMFNFKIGDA